MDPLPPLRQEGYPPTIYIYIHIYVIYYMYIIHILHLAHMHIYIWYFLIWHDGKEISERASPQLFRGVLHPRGPLGAGL